MKLQSINEWKLNEDKTLPSNFSVLVYDNEESIYWDDDVFKERVLHDSSFANANKYFSELGIDILKYKQKGKNIFSIFNKTNLWKELDVSKKIKLKQKDLKKEHKDLENQAIKAFPILKKVKGMLAKSDSILKLHSVTTAKLVAEDDYGNRKNRFTKDEVKEIKEYLKILHK